jgi:hypothetical protein
MMPHIKEISHGFVDADLKPFTPSEHNLSKNTDDSVNRSNVTKLSPF